MGRTKCVPARDDSVEASLRRYSCNSFIGGHARSTDTSEYGMLSPAIVGSILSHPPDKPAICEWSAPGSNEQSCAPGCHDVMSQQWPVRDDGLKKLDGRAIGRLQGLEGLPGFSLSQAPSIKSPFD